MIIIILDFARDVLKIELTREQIDRCHHVCKTTHHKPNRDCNSSFCVIQRQTKATEMSQDDEQL